MSGRSSPQLRSRSNNGSDRSGLPFGNAASGQSARLWVIDAEMASYFCLFAANFPTFLSSPFHKGENTFAGVCSRTFYTKCAIPFSVSYALSIRTFLLFPKKYDHHFLCPHLLFLCSRLKNTSGQSWLLH